MPAALAPGSVGRHLRSGLPYILDLGRARSSAPPCANTRSARGTLLWEGRGRPRGHREEAGAALHFPSARNFRMNDDLVRRIDALLPQTQCTRCGFDGCRPYATAIAEARADIDQCPPGGDPAFRRWRAAGPRGEAAQPGSRRSLRPPWRGDRRGRLHRLHQVHPGLPVDAIVGASKLHAHGDRIVVHRLRAVHPALPVDCIALAVRPRCPTPIFARTP
jgi:electron transport complex protein RnfB